MASIKYSTLKKVDDNGQEHIIYYKTCTDQVIDSNGINLTSVLGSFVQQDSIDHIYEKFETFSNVMRIKGILENSPDVPAINKLYEKVGMEVGDVYLVQVSDSVELVFELFVYTGTTYGWQYFGSSDKSDEAPIDPYSHTHYNKRVLDQIPRQLGVPGSVLMVSEDGTTLLFHKDANSMVEIVAEHDANIDSHPDIRQLIADKSDKPKAFNDILIKSGWMINNITKNYEYKYRSTIIESSDYFTISPVDDELNTITNAIVKARVGSTFSISKDQEGYTYATFTSKYKPDIDIPIFVLAYTQIDVVD